MFIIIHADPLALSPSNCWVQQLFDSLPVKHRVEAVPLSQSPPAATPPNPPSPLTPPSQSESPLPDAVVVEAAKGSPSLHLDAAIRRCEEQMQLALELHDSARDQRDDLLRLRK